MTAGLIAKEISKLGAYLDADSVRYRATRIGVKFPNDKRALSRRLDVNNCLKRIAANIEKGKGRQTTLNELTKAFEEKPSREVSKSGIVYQYKNFRIKYANRTD